MAKGSGSPLFDEINRAMQEPVRELHIRLIGYEMAIATLISALDRSGALPLVAAKSAIDELAAGIKSDALNAPIQSVLRQISARLAPPAPPPAARH